MESRGKLLACCRRGFHFLDYEDAELVLPFKLDRSKTKLGNFSYEGLARLKPGVTMAQASADVARMLADREPEFSAAGWIQRGAV